MNAALIALGGIVGVLLLALFGILRDGKRREEAWEEATRRAVRAGLADVEAGRTRPWSAIRGADAPVEPPADDHLWDVLRGGRE